MNIFFLDQDPKVSVSYYCDQHIVKLIMETAQMLSIPHHLESSKLHELLPKITQVNHPMAKWVRTNLDNYLLALEYFDELLMEYNLRYSRNHSYSNHYFTLINPPQSLVDSEDTSELTVPPACMPEQYKQPNCNNSWEALVASYRAYYIGEKKKMARYYHSKTPEFML